MIIPKPKSVVELFEGHPERWHKGASNARHNSNGTIDTFVDDENADCWCIVGGINMLMGEPRAVDMNIKLSLVEFNDAEERTFDEVLAKCKELGI